MMPMPPATTILRIDQTMGPMARRKTRNAMTTATSRKPDSQFQSTVNGYFLSDVESKVAFRWTSS